MQLQRFVFSVGAMVGLLFQLECIRFKRRPRRTKGEGEEEGEEEQGRSMGVLQPSGSARDTVRA